MESLPRFIKIGKDRVDIYEIISYGVEDEDYFYVDSKDRYEDSEPYDFDSKGRSQIFTRDALIWHYGDDNGSFDAYKRLAEWDNFFSENGLKWFIKLGDHRIRISEIVAYGISEYATENDGSLFVKLKNRADTFKFDEDEINIDEKIAELDRLFLGD